MSTSKGHMERRTWKNFKDKQNTSSLRKERNCWSCSRREWITSKSKSSELLLSSLSILLALTRRRNATSYPRKLSLIAAGSIEFQHPAQNLHGLLPPYRAGSEHVPAAVPAGKQSNDFLRAQSHFGDFPSEQQSASAAFCTQPQHLSHQQVPAARSNVFSPAQPPGDILNHIFDNENRVILPAQPQQRDYFNHTFDQQSQIALDNQLQNNVLSTRLQSSHLDNTFDQQSHTALNSSGLLTLLVG